MNEVHLTVGNFSSVVGFDQFSKDAINYAYHDILNAEMEWPFLHYKTSFLTVPGVPLYTVTSGNNLTIKAVDWEGFYIGPNFITSSVSNEVGTIPATTPFTYTPTNIVDWSSDLGVIYTSSGIAFTPVDEDPQTSGQYTLLQGVYYFNALDAGVSISVSYTRTDVSVINVINPIYLRYMDYDEWRQTRLNIDLNTSSISILGQPAFVIKDQTYGNILLSPVPDKIYSINFEYWADTPDLINPTDEPLFPSRFNQIILDGAQKYCYEFREDPQQAQMADARFKAGIARMRIELVNRKDDMKTGFYWRRYGWSYATNSY